MKGDGDSHDGLAWCPATSSTRRLLESETTSRPSRCVLRTPAGTSPAAARCSPINAARSLGCPAFSGQRNLRLIHAAIDPFRCSVRTSCGVR